MGSLCESSQTVPSLPTQSQSEDPTLVLPDLQKLKGLINKKSGEQDINITWSARKTSSSTDLSLILPASKNCSDSLITRYFLLYNFYISKYNQKSSDKKKFQSYFFSLMDQSCTEAGEKELLVQMKKDLEAVKTNQPKLNLMLLNYAFKSKFILEHLNKVLLQSDDPKALAYFIFPIHALHSAIIKNFDKPEIARKDNIWIVAVLQSKESELLKKMEGTQNYFFFSVFMRGFTDKKCANDKFKQLRKQNKKSTYLFTVNFPYDYTKMSTQQNKGFFIFKDANEQLKKRGDVIFNIMSSFKLSSKAEGFEYDIDYGQLARIYYRKVQERFIGKQPALLKIYQICRGVSKMYLKSQSCLCRIIGGKEQSLKVSQRVIKSSNSNVNQTVINDIERENIINTHMQNKQFDLALKQCGESQNLLIKAKKIQIFYEKGRFQEAKTEIGKIKESDLKAKDNFQSRLIIDLITARIQMNSNQYTKALQRLKQLYKAVKTKHPNDIQYIGRDVVSAIVDCEKKGGTQSDLQKTEIQGAGSYNALATTLLLNSMSIKSK